MTTRARRLLAALEDGCTSRDYEPVPSVEQPGGQLGWEIAA